MRTLLTGAAGFIGYHVAGRLLARGDEVFGVDSLNSYYAVALKHDRLKQLQQNKNFAFMHLDVADRELSSKLGNQGSFSAIVHLAAQAGVRYSTENPFAYIDANIVGQTAIMELASHLPARPPVIYASSSSVYGSSESVPFKENDRADQPVSIYAATKRAGELLARAYASLHGVHSVGLRFFTVYGRFGRPDMAPWLFADAILSGKPISVFNGGDMRRDFTHVDDIATGVVSALDVIVGQPDRVASVYNLGRGSPIQLLDFVQAIEHAVGKPAVINLKPHPPPPPPGDVSQTFADTTLASIDLGFAPKVDLRDGIADFVSWLRDYKRP